MQTKLGMDYHRNLRKYLPRFFGLFFALKILTWLSSCQTTPLLGDLSVNPTVISVDEYQVAEIEFTLTQPASVYMYLVDGSMYKIREGEGNFTYPTGRHTFLFNGLVQGYQETGEDYQFDIIQRLIPDGEYNIVVVADTGQVLAQNEHKVSIKNNLTSLPVINQVSVDPVVITPNDDGVDDAVKITLELTQNVKQLSVYAVSESGETYPIPELQGQSRPNAQGQHIFHFDALELVGEQLKNEIYSIAIDVYDVYGQHISWDSPVEIVDAGDIAAYVVDGAVTYTTSSRNGIETLCFLLSVRNDGEAFMRTTGPWSSETYKQTNNFVSLHFPEDKGVYRIGLDFETTEGQYPFRWAIGTPGIDLVQVDGEWYLPPDTTGSVSGCVNFDSKPAINPQYVWVGLLHEQTEFPLINHRVAPYLWDIKSTND